MARLAGVPHDWSTQRLAKEQEEAFRQAVEQLQRECGGWRVRGEDIRQLLAGQFGVAYSLNGVYDLMKRLGLVWISARAVSPCADPVAQAEFKKKPNIYYIQPDGYAGEVNLKGNLYRYDNS